jgi:hypothetical protein
MYGHGFRDSCCKIVSPTMSAVSSRSWPRVGDKQKTFWLRFAESLICRAPELTEFNKTYLSVCAV